MKDKGGRGLAPGVAGELKAHHPGRSRGPSAARSHRGHGAKPDDPSRSATRPRGVCGQLKAIGPLLESLEGSGGDYAWNQPRLTPRLETWVTPEAPGVLLPSKSGKSGRHGLSGLPVSAKAQIGDTLRVMEGNLRRVALWTVTLPDEDYLDLKDNQQWPVFQRAVIDGVTRLLKAAGQPPLVLGVVELGLKRTSRTGRPMPHIHLVMAGWGVRDRTGQWLLRPEVMDRLLADACRAAGLADRERPSGSRVEAIRKSVRSYLAPYLKKGSSVADADLSDGWEALVPHQWWNRSEAAKALVDGHLWRLPTAFAAFVAQEWARLQRLGLGRARFVEIGRRVTKTSDMAIRVLCFQWEGVEELRQGVEWFAVWTRDPWAIGEAAERCSD